MFEKNKKVVYLYYKSMHFSKFFFITFSMCKNYLTNCICVLNGTHVIFLVAFKYISLLESLNKTDNILQHLNSFCIIQVMHGKFVENYSFLTKYVYTYIDF